MKRLLPKANSNRKNVEHTEINLVILNAGTSYLSSHLFVVVRIVYFTLRKEISVVLLSKTSRRQSKIFSNISSDIKVSRGLYMEDANVTKHTTMSWMQFVIYIIAISSIGL